MKMSHFFMAIGICVFSVTSAAAQTPTFNDVAPIFQAKCQSCHEPGSIGPFSLATYTEARPWARSIKTRVATRDRKSTRLNSSHRT